MSVQPLWRATEFARLAFAGTDFCPSDRLDRMHGLSLGPRASLAAEYLQAVRVVVERPATPGAVTVHPDSGRRLPAQVTLVGRQQVPAFVIHRTHPAAMVPDEHRRRTRKRSLRQRDRQLIECRA